MDISNYKKNSIVLFVIRLPYTLFIPKREIRSEKGRSPGFMRQLTLRAFPSFRQWHRSHFIAFTVADTASDLNRFPF